VAHPRGAGRLLEFSASGIEAVQGAVEIGISRLSLQLRVGQISSGDYGYDQGRYLAFAYIKPA